MGRKIGCSVVSERAECGRRRRKVLNGKPSQSSNYVVHVRRLRFQGAEMPDEDV